MAKLPNIIEKEKSFMSTVFWSLGFAFRTNKKIFILAFSVTIVSAVVSFLNIISFSQIVNLLATGVTDFHKIVPYLIILFVVEFVPPVLVNIRGYLTNSLTRRTREHLDEKLSKKTTSLDIGTIEQPEFQDLLSKARRGAGSAISLIEFSFNILRDLTNFIFAAIIIIHTFALGFVIIFLTLVPTYLFERNVSKAVFELWEKQITSQRSLTAKTEIFRSKISLIEIKIANISNYFLSKIRVLQDKNTDDIDEFQLKRIPKFAFISLISNIGVIVVAAWIIFQVFTGYRLIGSLVLVWGAISRFSSAAESLFRSFGRIVEHHAHTLKLYSVFEMQSYISENENGLIYDAGCPKIEFKNVSFIYPGTEKKVLENLSFIISPKQEIAVVGLNGAGKTTLFRLLTRVYDPTEGEILINNIPLSEYNLPSWYRSISLMSQDYSIFQEETIKENILFNKIENSADLTSVIEEAGVSEYTSGFEKKLDQPIGRDFRGGVELSKGQTQKLAIARTLYPQTPVIILDEPTSAIDALSEDRTFKALRQNHKDQTRIIISHKFSNVRDADKIILIEHGTIIEQGSHDQLMKKKKGKYKELFELQAEGYK